jgi:hypothetical protein
MYKVDTKDPLEFIVIDKGFNKDIIITIYDRESFEGKQISLNIEQAKILVSGLQYKIYEGEE